MLELGVNMGTTRGIDVEYECMSAECEYCGCKGKHTIRVDFQRSTDIYIVVKDDKPLYYFDTQVFHAMLKSNELSRKK